MKLKNQKRKDLYNYVAHIYTIEIRLVNFLKEVDGVFLNLFKKEHQECISK